MHTLIDGRLVDEQVGRGGTRSSRERIWLQNLQCPHKVHHKDLISVAAENDVLNHCSDSLWSCHSLQGALQELRWHDEGPELVRVVLSL